jgi:hypothetical protein
VRAAVVPGTLGLLPSYRSLVDPLAELRSACLDAVRWLLEDEPAEVGVLGDPRVARALLDELGFGGEVVQGQADSLVVVANGSARRSEKAPGHHDERSFPYDDAIARALAAGDGPALPQVDLDLGAELLAAGLDGLGTLGAYGEAEATVLYDDDPYGVQYWVVTWLCRS